MVDRPHHSGGNPLPIAIIVTACGALGYFIYTAPAPPSPYGQGDAAFSTTAAETEVEVLITPVLINGEERTPTWAELQRAYRLRPRDLNRVMEIYNRQLPAGATPAAPNQRIRAGSIVVLPVE
jgi:hypothetical protein